MDPRGCGEQPERLEPLDHAGCDFCRTLRRRAIELQLAGERIAELGNHSGVGGLLIQHRARVGGTDVGWLHLFHGPNTTPARSVEV
jgi:hypothetical protein